MSWRVCSVLYPSQNRQDEGTGPGTPLAVLLMHSRYCQGDFPAFLADGKHFWHSFHRHFWSEPDAQIARGDLIFVSGVVSLHSGQVSRRVMSVDMLERRTEQAFERFVP